jgi:hypothetical protein
MVILYKISWDFVQGDRGMISIKQFPSIYRLLHKYFQTFKNFELFKDPSYDFFLLFFFKFFEQIL